MLWLTLGDGRSWVGNFRIEEEATALSCSQIFPPPHLLPHKDNAKLLCQTLSKI